MGVTKGGRGNSAFLSFCDLFLLALNSIRGARLHQNRSPSSPAFCCYSDFIPISLRRKHESSWLLEVHKEKKKILKVRLTNKWSKQSDSKGGKKYRPLYFSAHILWNLGAASTWKWLWPEHISRWRSGISLKEKASSLNWNSQMFPLPNQIIDCLNELSFTILNKTIEVLLICLCQRQISGGACYH